MASDLRAAVREAGERLAAAGIASPHAEAVAIAAHLLGTDRGEVDRAMILGAAVPEGYDTLVAQRATRVPLQHLTGRAGFRGLDLEVGPGVFVPRPETEGVAQLAIDAAREVAEGGSAPVVVDLCTGSGALALAVAAEVPGAEVVGVEVDPFALAWAGRNVEGTGLPVTLLAADATEGAGPGSALSTLGRAVDVVVSNPPYIPTTMEPVDPEVRDHDPRVALYGGSEDGLAIPLAVAATAAELLRPGGVLVMEHADEQGETLPRRLRATGAWTLVSDHPDLAGRPRATRATRG